ncbi:MAG: hypothetical protein ACLGI5_11135 [Thermoleophilia bacterium]
MTRRILVLLVACAVSLACAAPAQADLLADIFKDYTQDGRINPCSYSEKQLRDLKRLIPNDIEQYSDFGSAVDDALAKRAQGACNRGGSTPPGSAPAPPAATGAAPPPPPAAGTPSTAPPASGTAAPGAPAAAQPPPTPATAPTPAPDVASRDAIAAAARSTQTANEAPFVLIALAALAGLLALATLIFGLVRWRAWEPAWADRFRHTAGEAGWRASSTWAEFADFVRLGR